MRVVLYDDETMEPITVLHLESWMTDRLQSGERMLVPIFKGVVSSFDPDGPIGPVPDDRVCLWFEKFIRHGQEHWFCFTRDGENALQLRSVFLPGQWPAVHEEYKRGVAEGLIKGLGAVLRR